MFKIEREFKVYKILKVKKKNFIREFNMEEEEEGFVICKNN